MNLYMTREDQNRNYANNKIEGYPNYLTVTFKW